MIRNFEEIVEFGTHAGVYLLIKVVFDGVQCDVSNLLCGIVLRVGHESMFHIRCRGRCFFLRLLRISSFFVYGITCSLKFRKKGEKYIKFTVTHDRQ